MINLPDLPGGYHENPMRNYFNKLLSTFDYHSWTDLLQSLAPSFKYGLIDNVQGGTKMTVLTAGVSSFAAGANVFMPWLSDIFGIDTLAFSALIIAFIAELISGLLASNVKGEKISSMKLSRFSFKVFYYMVLIALPYLMSESFEARQKIVPAAIFDWLHVFLVSQIVMENIISILENMAVLGGKDKTHWISKIQDKLNGLLK